MLTISLSRAGFYFKEQLSYRLAGLVRKFFNPFQWDVSKRSRKFHSQILK